MTPLDDTAGLGTDTALKMRLASLSPAAARPPRQADHHTTEDES